MEPLSFKRTISTRSVSLRGLHLSRLKGNGDTLIKRISFASSRSSLSPVFFMARVQINDKWGFIDKTGDLVIKAQFEMVFDFSDGLARIVVDKKSGFIDNKGKSLIAPQFETAYSFSEGLANV
jgi:hypothetical protein